MAEIRTAHLFTITLTIGSPQSIGAEPAGSRRVVTVAGGRFEGERLRGTIGTIGTGRRTAEGPVYGVFEVL